MTENKQITGDWYWNPDTIPTWYWAIMGVLAIVLPPAGMFMFGFGVVKSIESE